MAEHNIEDQVADCLRNLCAKINNMYAFAGATYVCAYTLLHATLLGTARGQPERESSLNNQLAKQAGRR